MKIPELLAPVGSIEHLKIAIFSGASSIYLSGKKYGARQYTENLNLNQIKEAVKFAHLYNVKVYVTVNILIKEEELLNVIEYLLNLYKIGVDAVLIQDIGIVKLVREIIPNLAIHGSTQMNIQNKEGMEWAVANGIKRVVLPRELNLTELKEITVFSHENGVEVEMFIHGALCYAYSGRCLFSSFKGGRSGNRGNCAQPCRQRYQIAIKTNDKKVGTEKTLAIRNNDKQSNNEKTLAIPNEDKQSNNEKTLFISNEKYFLSPKDLSLFNELETIGTIGIDSLKIEGRMRNKDYVSIVVNSYRKLLNKLKYMKNSNFNKFNNEFKKKGKKYKKFKNKRNEKHSSSFKKDFDYKKSIENLKLVFNREFTTGHLLNQSSEEILNIESPGDSGLYIGKVDSFFKKTGEITISLDSNLIVIPEKGDGLVIKGKKLALEKNKNNQDNIKNSKYIEDSYGLELSKTPILKEKSESIGQKLIIKKVKENKKINIEFDKNSKVYLNKRRVISNYTKKLINDKSKQIIRKSRVFIQFDIGKLNYPILKGKAILANGKKIDIHKRSNVPWEIAKNKPITKEQLKEQLSKIGDLPFYIEKISINYKEDLFTPISEINKLRREFFKDLENQIINSYLPDENEFKLVKNNFKKFKKIKNKENNGDSENKKNKGLIEKNKKGKETEKDNVSSLAIYLNNLDTLKSLNEKNNLYNRVYIEIPPKNKYSSFKSREDKEKLNKIDISYIVNFIKEAIAISKDQSYELIWKWPDIAHQNMIDDFTKALAILKKLNMGINVMSGLLGIANHLKEKFEIEVYGSYPLNSYNNMSILKLNEYKLFTLSPELSNKEISNIIKEYLKSKDDVYNDTKKSISTSKIQVIPDIEILVHGNIELMVSKNDLISKKLLENIDNTLKSENCEINEFDSEFYLVLKDSKNNEFPIKKDLNGNDRILLNSENICLINDIYYLKSIGFENFAIDGRWESIEYIKNIGAIYKKNIQN